MGLLECLKEYEGKWITPPRNEVFNVNAQRYQIIKVNEDSQGVDCKFESGTPIRLHFWRFNHVVDILNAAKGEYVQVGSSLNSEYDDTIEGGLVKKAVEEGYLSAGLRTAPFVCDLIVQCGYAEYGVTVNPRTGRKVQGIRRIKKRITVEVVESPPKNQTEAWRRTSTKFTEKLDEIRKKELKDNLITSPVSVEISIYCHKSRIQRTGSGKYYVGNLDNLVLGIIYELRGRIIQDDSQVMEIVASKIVCEHYETRFEIIVSW